MRGLGVEGLRIEDFWGLGFRRVQFFRLIGFWVLSSEACRQVWGCRFVCVSGSGPYRGTFTPIQDCKGNAHAIRDYERTAQKALERMCCDRFGTWQMSYAPCNIIHDSHSNSHVSHRSGHEFLVVYQLAVAFQVLSRHLRLPTA